MKLSILKDNKGFSALGLFLLGLALLTLMGASGFFVFPKSTVSDKNSYTATGSRKVENNKGLIMTDLDFTTPTPQPTPQITVTPPVPIPGCVPPPGNYCPDDTERTGCQCNPCKPVWLYCNGNLPPAPATCMDESVCKNLASDPTCKWFCMAKPVIYLYPEKSTFVTVTLLIPGAITESIPLIENWKLETDSFTGGWRNVLALPGGILKYQNNYYRELYYESSIKNVNAPDNGIFISTEKLKEELKSETLKLGLIDIEADEFASYWLPRLQQLNKPYIFFSIIDKTEKERTDKVEISPKPDVFIEFIAYFKGTDERFQTKPLAYPAVPNRKGFTAVEWGGVIGR